MKTKKLTAAILAATLSMSVLAGCGDVNKKGGSSESGNVLTYNLGADPKTLDPALNSAVDGSIVISNLFVGLAQVNENNEAVPGVAESWDVSEDGTVYTFHIKKGTKWSNGEEVKPSDFEYAWKRVIDPATASEYSYQMYYIKNAQEANQKEDIDKDGKTAGLDDVGIKADDENYTLEVTLEAPCSYFLNLTAFPCYLPVCKSVVEADENWATKADTYVCNGPFKMTEYSMKDKIILEKNENYFDKDSVTLDKLDMRMVTDSTSAWASYTSGQFDMVDTVPTDNIQEALANNTAQKFDYLANTFLCVNVDKAAEKVDKDAAKALANPKVRKALALAIDRKSLVENVTKGGQVPAKEFVPNGITDVDGQDFAKNEYIPAEANVEEAKKLLEEAGYKEGSFPSITLMTNSEGENGKLMQAIQDMWKQNLGIDVKLESQEWKVFQDTKNSKNYLVARHGWAADYVDPMTFLDMWTSKSEQNNAGYNNPKFDKAIADAKKESDPEKRSKLLHEAEDMIMEDMPIIPLYNSCNIKGVKDYVKGVRVNSLGQIYFDKVTVEKH